jgi:hypothetical protein
MKSKLSVFATLGAAALLVSSSGMAMGASMFLNEYNAVKSTSTLKSPGTDSYFGLVMGNGGDWMEFVVTQDLDIRGWSVVTTQAGAADATIVLPSTAAFASLKSGTIFTIAEDVATDMSFNPGTNDWWVNYQASFSFVDATNDNFQVWIYNSADDLIFGPAGEGVYPLSGVGGDEVFKLETNPSASITNDSIYYKDGTSSTFGAPNLWSAGAITQDFSLLRNIDPVPEPSSILALLSGIAGFGGIALKRRK